MTGQRRETGEWFQEFHFLLITASAVGKKPYGRLNTRFILMTSRQWSVVGVVIFITAFIAMAKVMLGALPAIIFSVASIGGFWITMSEIKKARQAKPA